MNQGRVLVVDDLPNWQKIIEELLSDEGYSVMCASDVRIALQLLASMPFQLAILDVRLDETDENNSDGIWLMHEIHRNYPSVKVIINTGYGTPFIVREVFKEMKPAFAFLSKTETDHLVDIVKKAFLQVE